MLYLDGTECRNSSNAVKHGFHTAEKFKSTQMLDTMLVMMDGSDCTSCVRMLPAQQTA